MFRLRIQMTLNYIKTKTMQCYLFIGQSNAEMRNKYDNLVKYNARQ